MSYSDAVKNKMEDSGAEPGDRVEITTKDRKHVGVLMPASGGSEDVVVLKLDGGYNIGIDINGIVGVKRLPWKEEELQDGAVEGVPGTEVEGMPEVSVLMAGGTIASRVDYRTGAVKASVGEEELIGSNPELAEVASLETRVIMNTLSENMSSSDWVKIAGEVKKEIDKGKDGVVVAHGTDTMGYSSAALSFMLEDLSVPVVLVGSQRSSDRGSSDSNQNLVCAVRAATSDIAEVMVCMHGTTSDNFCYLHSGTKVRKMHTSRRDAFRTVNGRPYAKVDWETRELETVREDYRRKDEDRETKLRDGFCKDVALVKVYPGMDHSALESHLEGTKGVVIEGTGLGHVPIKNEEIRNVLEEYIDRDNIVFMTSQCLYGRVNMNVYETGVDLVDIGVIGNLHDMLPETAYVKLGWLLGNYDKEEARELMLENMRGEISERTEHKDLVKWEDEF